LGRIRSRSEDPQGKGGDAHDVHESDNCADSGNASRWLTGLAIGNLVNELYLAMIAGVLATIIAGVVRNTSMTRVGKEPHSSGIPQLIIIYSAFTVDRRIPLRVIIYSVVASLAGSIAAVQIADQSELTSSVWVGTLAGLFAGILMAMLMLVYDMNPAPPSEV
jgi:hypothetical protein